mgnify:CR=1 FL=1
MNSLSDLNLNLNFNLNFNLILKLAGTERKSLVLDLLKRSEAYWLSLAAIASARAMRSSRVSAFRAPFSSMG